MKNFIVTVLDNQLQSPIYKDIPVQADNLQITPDSTLVFIDMKMNDPNNGTIKRVFARGYWIEAKESSVSIN